MNETIKKGNFKNFLELIEVEELIKEVQDYFKNKILNKDFKIEKITQHLLTMSIEGYIFHLWIGNLNIVKSIGIYHSEKSFMDLDFSQKEKLELQKTLKPKLKKHFEEYLLKEKEAELDKLRKSLDL